MRRLSVPHPGCGEVRIKVAYVGMNPVDAMVRRERLDWMPVEYPLVPGLEHSGVVEAVGEGVSGDWEGKRVLSRVSFGGYADYSIAPAASLIRVPDQLSLKEACVYRGCSTTAWHALLSVGRLGKGESVLIHSAAGAVGVMALQIAADAGAQVVGLAGGPAKVAYARGFADRVVDYLDDDWPAAALAANDGAPFDVILDGNGGERSEHNYSLIRTLGRVVYIGATAGSYPEPVPIPKLIGKSFAVAGMTLRQVEGITSPGTEAEIIRAIVERRWKIPITETVALSEAASLHRRLENREVMGRAVIRVAEDLE
jgi:NADPH2:quinone reductase